MTIPWVLQSVKLTLGFALGLNQMQLDYHESDGIMAPVV